MASSELAARISATGLPDSVARIAVDGGETVHPELFYRARQVGNPSWAVIEGSGRDDLIPLWTCGITTVFRREDGTFVKWDAEDSAPTRAYPTFHSLIRSLLTDLYEDEVGDDDRRAIAEPLLPSENVDDALVIEQR